MKYVDGPTKSGWDGSINYNEMGKWAIIYLNDHKFYWCYGDGGEPTEFCERKGLLGYSYRGLIDTWSRDYHIYEARQDFYEVESTLGSGNIWAFNWDEYNEYGVFIRDNVYGFDGACGP